MVIHAALFFSFRRVINIPFDKNLFGIENISTERSTEILIAKVKRDFKLNK